MSDTVIISDENRDDFIRDIDELGSMFDKEITRGRVYVSMITTIIESDDYHLLKWLGTTSLRLQQEAGLGAIISEEPFGIPLCIARLGGAITTFYSEHNKSSPVTLVHMMVSGAIISSMELRSRARDALSENLLKSVNTILLLTTHVLTHLATNMSKEALARSPLTETVKESITECSLMLLDSLDDSDEETAYLSIHIIVLLNLFSPDQQLYGLVQRHRLANSFGTGFISLINSTAFTKSSTDSMADISFAEMMITTESAASTLSRSSSVLYPGDVTLLAEVLQREIRDNDPTSERSKAYSSLLKLIANSPLKPDSCSIKL